eukprot:2490367-Rhodomonas_salina.1
MARFTTHLLSTPFASLLPGISPWAGWSLASVHSLTNPVLQEGEEKEEEVKPVSKNKKYRREKPWDTDDIDHWKVRYSVSRSLSSFPSPRPPFRYALCLLLSLLNGL